jgi:hypothetical protein
METEDGHLRFLDTDICRRLDDCLGRMVSWLATPTNLYLNSGSHHHPSTKQGTLYTLVHRARALCYAESLHAELDFLQSAVSDDGCSQKEI